MDKRELMVILGGARSGKSAWAQRLAAAQHNEVLFVATAEPRDEEMAARIAQHRATRPGHWRTLEAPRAVAQALSAAEPAPVVVLDCVTLWVSNLLLADGATWEAAVAELDALLRWYQTHQASLIVVSNEVGLGIVPGDALSRAFREWLGWFNQRLAAEANVVYWMVAGLAVELKALNAATVHVCPIMEQAPPSLTGTSVATALGAAATSAALGTADQTTTPTAPVDTPASEAPSQRRNSANYLFFGALLTLAGGAIGVVVRRSCR
jgi:adenosylcobinamide kinase/adenosylcobinamide-phosphate guanylyltransferase